jgi:hypothetical protein
MPIRKTLPDHADKPEFLPGIPELSFLQTQLAPCFPEAC